MKYEKPQKQWGFLHGINLPMHAFFPDFRMEKKLLGKIKRVSEAEDLLRGLGFYQFRVRSHGTLLESKFCRRKRRFFEQSLRDTITKELRKWVLLTLP